MKGKYTRYFDTLKQAEQQAFDWHYNLNKEETDRNRFVYDRPAQNKRIVVKPSSRGFKMTIYDLEEPKTEQ